MVILLGPKRIDIKEFREKGYLQEVNRRFFHPLGLALEVVIDEGTGEERLFGVWDSREDPEGFMFGGDHLQTEEAKKKKENIDAEMQEKKKHREKNLGYHIQPLD